MSDDRVIFSLVQEGIVRGSDTILLGLRGPAVTPDTLAWLQARDVRYHTMTAIERRGLERVLGAVMREVERGPERFYLSVDVSVLDPAQLVAAGRATPHGLETRAVTRAIRRVCATKDIAGFEVTDLAPMLDSSPQSTLAANALLNACLVGMAVRAEGLDPDHVHPLVASHGQR